MEQVPAAYGRQLMSEQARALMVLTFGLQQ